MQRQIDLLTNQIDLSEIAPGQVIGGESEVESNYELMNAIELLAKDIGYGYSKKGIEAALDCSDMTYNNEEAIQVIEKASSKIRELRELIENLSKKLWISENGGNLQIIKLKESIEKLKKQNKKLLNDKLGLEEVMNQTIGTPKPAYTNYISTSQKALKGKISIIV